MVESHGNGGEVWPPPAPDSPGARRRWPPPAPDSPGARRRRPPPERHAHWIDHDNRANEPREDAPRLLWWILAGLLIFGVFSVLIRMFLVL